MLPQIPGLTDLRPLGEGGFATVYTAYQPQLARQVAVKIDNRALTSERDRRRFLREARAAAKLSGHPNVVGVYDANITAHGTPYLVMELCEGGSLAGKRMSADEAQQLGVQLADALAAAHAAGVLHRDIKPGNILVDRYGTAKLADFGLAALLDTQGGSTVTRDALSPSYAAPEAFAMAEPTPQADVYSLAATLYHLMAGKPPRPVPWPIQSFDHLGEVLRSPIPPIPGVPQQLHDTLARALHPDASLRTSSAAQLRDELRNHAAPSRPPKKLWPVIVAVLIVLVTAGVLLWTTNQEKSTATPGTTTTEAAPPPFLQECAGGYCMAEPTCYRGTVEIGGQAATARRTGDCAEEHYWEAFGGGWLSGDIPKVGSDELAKAPEVKDVCTTARMKTATRPTVDTSTWQIIAVGFESGGRSYFHCLASPEEGGETTTSAFGR